MGRAGATTDRGDGLATKHVPFVDLKIQAVELRAEFDAAFTSVTSRAAYTMGPELTQFEEAFAAFCGCSHAVGVSSGTDAVKLALIAAGVRPGDEVIVPANTFIATAEAVSHIGATPVFVDCLESNGLMDTAAVGPAVTPRTTAVVPVHLYGQPVDMDALAEVASAHGLAVVEDACQAHGATYKGRPVGSLGVTAAFSFYPGKNLGALGRRRRGHHQRRRRRRDGAPVPQPRAGGQVHAPGGRLLRPPAQPAGGSAAGQAAASGRLERGPAHCRCATTIPPWRELPV